jgi:hypothetical protein
MSVCLRVTAIGTTSAWLFPAQHDFALVVHAVAVPTLVLSATLLPLCCHVTLQLCWLSDVLPFWMTVLAGLQSEVACVLMHNRHQHQQ